VVQPTEHGDGDHGASITYLLRGSCGAERTRCALLDALMWSIAVEVGDVLGQHAPEVQHPEDERVVDALARDLPRRRSQSALARGARTGVRITAIALAAARRSNAEPYLASRRGSGRGSDALRRRLAELLGDPGVGGGAGDADMDHAP
jgi:hypothetical protein